MSSNKIKDLNDKIEQMRKELEELEAAQKEEERLTPVYKLAIALHENLCHANHTDGCGWYYEFKNKRHDWDGNSHSWYLEKAVKLKEELHKNQIDLQQAIRTLEIMVR